MLTSLKNKFEEIKRNLEEIPSQYRRWSTIGIFVAFLIALPLTIIAFNTGNFELRKRAATGEITPTPTPPPVVITPTPTPTPATCILSGGKCLQDKACTARKGFNLGQLDCKAGFVCCQLPPKIR